jgi:hypothetical protein
MAGAATGGRAAGAGSAAAGRRRRELDTYLGVARAHESFTILFFAFRTIYLRITTEYQFFKIFTAVVAMKFKDGHVKIFSLNYFNLSQQQ